MDDDKGLDLSLGLPCGGSSTNSKDRSGNSADARTATDERTSKIVNDFKNFLNAGIPQTYQSIDPVKPQENFFNNFSQTGSGGNASSSGPVIGDKRKSMFNEMNNQKKQETEARSPDLQDKGKTSYISITTDEGSTADNEDVAESEAEGSSSRTVSHCEDGLRTHGGNSGSSKVPKEIHAKANVRTPPFPVQTLNALSSPYSITIKESSAVGLSSTSSYPRVSMMQSIPCASGERPALHITTPGNVPMTFGYSSVRVPMIDKDSPWRMVAHPHSLHSPYAGRAIPTSVPPQVTNPSSSGVPRPDLRPSEQVKGQTKPLAGEEGSSWTQDEVKREENSFPSEYPAIRPGIAADVKFGGSGSCPNLPWVSTTGPGPNGRTISGVTYKYNATEVKIVCACHGTHMSPDEFIHHAAEQQPNTAATPSLAPLPNGNPAASSKS